MVNVISAFSTTEKYIKKYSILFTLIVMFQGLFGGMSLENKPSKLDKLSKNPFFKYFTLFCIAFTATKDIEISLISVVAFVFIINVIRTPKERENLGVFNL